MLTITGQVTPGTANARISPATTSARRQTRKRSPITRSAWDRGDRAGRRAGSCRAWVHDSEPWQRLSTSADGEPERAGEALEVDRGLRRGLVAGVAAPPQVGEPVEQPPGRVLSEPQIDLALHPGRDLGGTREVLERRDVEGS